MASAMCRVLPLVAVQAQNPPVPAVGIDLGTTMTVVARYYMVGEGTQGGVFINEQDAERGPL